MYTQNFAYTNVLYTHVRPAWDSKAYVHKHKCCLWCKHRGWGMIAALSECYPEVTMRYMHVHTYVL